LRTELASDYVVQISQVFANCARMSVAANDELVVGIAVWRVVVSTYEGCRFYIDDLVKDES